MIGVAGLASSVVLGYRTGTVLYSIVIVTVLWPLQISNRPFAVTVIQSYCLHVQYNLIKYNTLYKVIRKMPLSHTIFSSQ